MKMNASMTRYQAIEKLILYRSAMGKNPPLKVHKLQELRNEVSENFMIDEAKMKNFLDKKLKCRNF